MLLRTYRCGYSGSLLRKLATLGDRWPLPPPNSKSWPGDSEFSSLGVSLNNREAPDAANVTEGPEHRPSLWSRAAMEALLQPVTPSASGYTNMQEQTIAAKLRKFGTVRDNGSVARAAMSGGTTTHSIPPGSVPAAI